MINNIIINEGLISFFYFLFFSGNNVSLLDLCNKIRNIFVKEIVITL